MNTGSALGRSAHRAHPLSGRRRLRILRTCALGVAATLVIHAPAESAEATPPPKFNLLVVPVDFATEPAAFDWTDARTNWADGLEEFIDRMSDGQTDLRITLLTVIARPSGERWRYHHSPMEPPPGEDTYGLWNDPLTGSVMQDALDSSEIELLSAGLAPAGGSSEDVFDGILFVQPPPDDTTCTYASRFGGWSTGPACDVLVDPEHCYYVGYDELDVSGDCAITGQSDWGGAAHEIGHMLTGNFGHPSGYDNAFDTLDSGYPHAGAYGGYTRMDAAAGTGREHAWFQGWINFGHVVTYDPPTSGTETLEPIAYSASPGAAPNVIRVGTSRGYYYTLECRREVLTDTGIPEEGIVILKVTPGAHPEAEVQGGVDNAFAPGDSFTDATADLRIDANPFVGDGCAVSISYGPTATSGSPDVGIVPWLSPPEQTWETVDLWVDSSCNGYEEDAPGDPLTLRYGRRTDPEQSVIGNGDDPCFDHENRLYARVRNFGTATADNVKVRFEVSDPLGVGIQPDTGWAEVGEAPIISSLAPGAFADVYVPWVPSAPETLGIDEPDRFAYHSCFRVVMDAVSGEIVLANQDGDREQENIDYFEIRRDRLSGSYSPAERHIFISNLGNNFEKRFWLGVESTLPPSWSLTIGDGSSNVVVPAGSVLTIPVRIEVPFGTPLDQAYRVRVAAYEEVAGSRSATHMKLASALVIEARTVEDAWNGLRAQRYQWGNGQLTAVSACLGAPIATPQRVTVDYVSPSGLYTPQNVQTDVNGCFQASMFSPSDHPVRVRVIWHGNTDFARAVSQDVSPMAADCCVSTSASGCAYPDIEECVCAVDSYCCNYHWDSICVSEVASLGCGACHDACTTGDPQTREDDIEACICARDPYCCTTSWDGICVSEVESFGCGTCAGTQQMSGGVESMDGELVAGRTCEETGSNTAAPVVSR